MSDEIYCPNCHAGLSEAQLKSMWAEYCGSKKSSLKSDTARKNGEKGGRPTTYFQALYDAVPESIKALEKKLEDDNARHRYSVKRINAPRPTETGFTIACEDIQWHCFWDGISPFISISEGGEQRAGISRVNYAANRAAAKLVQDIHREKLMRMPEDFSDIYGWIEQMTGRPYKPPS